MPSWHFFAPAGKHFFTSHGVAGKDIRVSHGVRNHKYPTIRKHNDSTTKALRLPGARAPALGARHPSSACTGLASTHVSARTHMYVYICTYIYVCISFMCISVYMMGSRIELQCSSAALPGPQYRVNRHGDWKAVRAIDGKVPDKAKASRASLRQLQFLEVAGL